MRFSDEKRILARTLVWNSSVGRLMLADRSGDIFSVSHFDFETADTVFLDGVAVCLSRNVNVADVVSKINEVRRSCGMQLNPSELCAGLLKINALATEGAASAEVSVVILD